MLVMTIVLHVPQVLKLIRQVIGRVEYQEVHKKVLSLKDESIKHGIKQSKVKRKLAIKSSKKVFDIIQPR